MFRDVFRILFRIFIPYFVLSNFVSGAISFCRSAALTVVGELGRLRRCFAPTLGEIFRTTFGLSLLLVDLLVRYFENPVTVTPNRKFQKLEILPKFPRILNVYFWGDNVYFWGNKVHSRGFSKILGFLEFLFSCWGV